MPANEKAYNAANGWDLVQRVKHVIESAFNGRIITIFSGGEKKNDDNAVLEEVRQLAQGGGFGSIMGRNLFQRSKDDALALASKVVAVYQQAVAD